jgi:predicted ArsR family transcriptional regulator
MNHSDHHDPKRRVLSLLKRNGAVSTQAIASVLDVSAVATRQHLFALEKQGLVLRTTATPGARGRPGALWKLTPLADDLFPDRHDALTVDLIDAINTALGPAALQQVVGARTERQFADLRQKIVPGADLCERLEALAAQRSAEGYMAEVTEEADGSLLLIEHHCPICDAARTCQLLCTTELDLFKRVLGPDVDVRREQHLIAGDDRCVYRVAPLDFISASAWGGEKPV